MDRTDASPSWAELSEHGMLWGMRFVLASRRLLGRRLCNLVLLPIVTWFWLTDAGRRHASMDYLRRVRAMLHLSAPRWWHGLTLWHAFAEKALDGVMAAHDPTAIGPCVTRDPDGMAARAAAGQGGMILVSHLGNPDVARAVMAGRFPAGMTVLMHTRHAVMYNHMLDRLHGSPLSRTLEVTDMAPDTAIDLQQRLERGEWLAMAADRTPIHPGTRIIRTPFLGAEAPFPTGPFILAALLRCPVFLLFCVKNDNGYEIHLEHFADSVILPRRDRERVLVDYVKRYVGRLEKQVIQSPMQWYNFYSFWDQ